jgi:hypothetical protein
MNDKKKPEDVAKELESVATDELADKDLDEASGGVVAETEPTNGNCLC